MNEPPSTFTTSLPTPMFSAPTSDRDRSVAWSSPSSIATPSIDPPRSSVRRSAPLPAFSPSMVAPPRTRTTSLPSPMSANFVRPSPPITLSLSLPLSSRTNSMKDRFSTVLPPGPP